MINMTMLSVTVFDMWAVLIFRLICSTSNAEICIFDVAPVQRQTDGHRRNMYIFANRPHGLKVHELKQH